MTGDGETTVRIAFSQSIDSARVSGNITIGEIAHACGYSTLDGLRLAFDRNLGVTPREYRLRFC